MHRFDWSGCLGKKGRKKCTPITIGACDNGALYDIDVFKKLVSNPSVDIIVWGVRNYPTAMRHPKMFGWVDADEDLIRSISVKTPLETPASDPIVLGTFTFRRAEDFRRALERLIKRDGRINGEFYIDSLINDAIALGLRCHLFEVDSYLCWGTPNDLRTFEYNLAFISREATPIVLKAIRLYLPKLFNILRQDM